MMLLLNREDLEFSREEVAAAEYPPNLEELLQRAEAASRPPFRTVMDKAQLPPSGDRHDYLSYGPYWWPDPARPDGLPYIRRDGLLNPATAESDRASLEALMRDCETLALAYFYSGTPSFAEAAATRLRAWFLDPATRMNPHLNYGQAVPGVCDGRGIGIIDTVKLRLLPDILELLRGSAAWTVEDDAAVRQWLGQYLEWLLTSEHGRDEASQHNNHGTWYDVQVALFALATGRTAVAEQVLRQAAAKRFAPHITADGSQPHELGRTRSFSYSCYNLIGLFDLARLAEHVGQDLWHWHGAGGASLERALLFLAPYADSAVPWPHEQVVEDPGSALLELLRRAMPTSGGWGLFHAYLHASLRSPDAMQLEMMWPVPCSVQ